MPRKRQRVAVVTGSPNETRLLPQTSVPAKPRKQREYKVPEEVRKTLKTYNMTPEEIEEWRRQDREDELAELRWDASYASSYADEDVMNRTGIILADYEPLLPVERLPVDLLDRLRSLRDRLETQAREAA